MSRAGRTVPWNMPIVVITPTITTIGSDTEPSATISAAEPDRASTATSSCLGVLSTRKPPASTPTALATRYAVSAVEAAASGVSWSCASAVTMNEWMPLVASALSR